MVGDRVATLKRRGFGGPLLAQALDNSKFALLFSVPESRSFPDSGHAWKDLSKKDQISRGAPLGRQHRHQGAGGRFTLAMTCHTSPELERIG